MLLDSIFGTRSIENPSTPLSSAAYWLYDAFGAEKSAAGVRINSNTALSISAWWRGINLVSGDIGKLPLCVFRRINGGKNKEAYREHPAYKLAKYPNQEMTSSVFKRTLQGHAMSEGNGYGYIRRTNGATPFELLPLNPRKTYPVRYRGILTYLYTPHTDDPKVLESGDLTEQVRKIPAMNMLHVKGLGFDGLSVYSVVQMARDALGRARAMEVYGARYFRNSARPSVVIEHPNKLTEKAAANLRSSWGRLHEGVDNAHRTDVLEEGMKLSSFQINARDSQLIESEQHSLIEIANFLGLPPHKVGHPSRTAFASLEQENQSYLDDCLMHWLTAWDEEWEAKLLTEAEKSTDEVTVEFITQALLKGDMAARSAFYHNALLDGWMSRDEVRAFENMNPMPDGEGEKFYVPGNMVIAGESPPAVPAAGATPAEPPAMGDTPDDDMPMDRSELLAVHRDLLSRSVRRMLRRVSENAKRQSKKPATFLDFLDKLSVDHKPVMVEDFQAPIAAVSILSKRKRCPETLADMLLAEVRDKLLTLSGTCTPDALPETVETFLADYETARPAQIAETLIGSTCYA